MRLELLADPLIGRLHDLEALEKALDDGVRLLTVLGPGGVGKSRLAAELVDRRGGLYLELADRHGDLAVEDALVEALGLGGRAGPRLARLAETLSRRGHTLVVLDNLEHLLPQASESVLRLLRLAPDAQVLVTSRRSTDLPEEQALRLAPLSSEQARTLFLRHAPREAALPEEDLDQLLAVLDGLPLALQLAAARLDVLSLAELLRRLQAGKLSVLRHPEARQARHASLDALLTQSWDALPPTARSGLVRIGVFRGGAPLDALEALLGDEALDVLHLLVRHSLVRRERPEHGPTRYSVLEVVRAWVLGRADDVEAEAARVAHAAWYATHAPIWSTSVFTSGPGRHRVLAERLNLLAAHAHALAAGAVEALDLVGALRLVLLRTMPLDDQQALFDNTIAAFEPLPSTSGAARALHGAGYLALIRRETARASALFARALAIAIQVDDLEARLDIDSDAVHADVIAGDKETARARLQGMIDLTDPAHHDQGIHARARLANMTVWLGDPEGAAARLEPLGEAVARRTDVLAGFVAYSLARSLGDVDRPADAARWWRFAVDVLEPLGLPFMLAEVRSGLVAILTVDGDEDEAVRVHAPAVEAARQDPDHHQLTWLIEGLRSLRSGDVEGALHGLGIAARAGAPNDQGRFQAALARLGLFVHALEGGDAAGIEEGMRHLAHDAAVLPMLGRPAMAPLRDALRQWGESGIAPDIPPAPGFPRLLADAALAAVQRRRILLNTVAVARDGSWVQLPSAPIRQLGHRKNLAAVLARLAEGGVVDVEDLARAGWPDDAASPDALRNRVWVALSTLRKLGVAVDKDEAGYRLAPDVRICPRS